MDIDYINLFEISFSTFLGFLSAILATVLIDKRNEKTEVKKIIHNTKNELSEMLEILTNLEADYYINPIKFSYWKSLISGNKLNLLCDEIWYVELLLVYDHVIDFNEWNNKRTEILFLNGKGSFDEFSLEINEAIQSQVIIIIKEINSVLENMSK